jgi:hypothetical protein
MRNEFSASKAEYSSVGSPPNEFFHSNRSNVMDGKGGQGEQSNKKNSPQYKFSWREKVFFCNQNPQSDQR